MLDCTEDDIECVPRRGQLPREKKKNYFAPKGHMVPLKDTESQWCPSLHPSPGGAAMENKNSDCPIRPTMAVVGNRWQLVGNRWRLVGNRWG